MTQKRRRPLPPVVAGINSTATLTAAELLSHVKSGDISVEEYCSACAEVASRVEPRLKAWTWYDPDYLVSNARKADALIRANGVNGGRAPKSLIGVPVGVKDIFNTIDMPTMHGSAIFSNYTPGNDARVVTSLRRRDAIVAGKTATAEFAVHTAPETRNPWDLERSTGTSSSGSAAAVASCMVPVALSSQTASSTIRPASYCGIYGLKPSFGLLPRTAMLKTTDTLDTVAIMARSVGDLALLFDVMRVRGPNYPIVDRELARPDRHNISGKTWRIGIVEGPQSNIEHPAMKAGIKRIGRWLQGLGCSVDMWRMPADFDNAHDVHRIIYHKALSYYFKMEWERAGAAFSQQLADIVVEGRQISVEAYYSAIAEQTRLSAFLDEQLAQRYDIIISAAAADEAPVGHNTPDPLDHSLIWTMCHAPSMTLPLLSGPNGLPLGVQITARRFDDYKLIKFATLLDGFDS